MKKRGLILAAALLACIPVWASAQIEIIGKDNNQLGKYDDDAGMIEITSAMDGATITGSAEGVYLLIQDGVKELTLNGVTITGPSRTEGVNSGGQMTALRFQGGDGSTLNLKIQKDNSLTGGDFYNGPDMAGSGIEVPDGNLIITGDEGSSLKVSGGFSTDSACGHGIEMYGTLTIDSGISVKAYGGDVRRDNDGAGIGIRTADLIVQNGSTVEAFGGDSESAASAGILVYNSISIKDGSTVTATGGAGPMSTGVALQGDIFVDNSTLTAKGNGVDSMGIVMMGSGKLKVIGNSCVTAEGAEGAAVAWNQVPAPAQIEADGLVIRAGDSEAKAVVVDAYNTLERYLRIGEPIVPAVPGGGAAAIGNANLPQTGDGSSMGLWLMLACASMLGMVALHAKKEA